MKLVISKNKDGKGYYSKIQNDFNEKHTEKYLNIQVPKGEELEYGLYEVDGFLSTYEKKDGTVDFKFIITKYAKLEFKKEEKTEEPKEDPFAEMGRQVTIDEYDSDVVTDDDLPF